MSLTATDKAIPQVVIKPPVVLLVNVPLRRESSDLPRELRGELGSVEPVDVPDPALPFQQLLVVRIYVVSEHRDEPHPGDDHPLLGIRLATGRGLGDGGEDGAGRGRGGGVLGPAAGGGGHPPWGCGMSASRPKAEP